MREELKEILKKYGPKLQEEVDPTFLWTHWFANDTITKLQWDECKAKSTTFFQMEQLLEYLRNKDDSCFDKFMVVLDSENGVPQLAMKLRDEMKTFTAGQTGSSISLQASTSNENAKTQNDDIIYMKYADLSNIKELGQGGCGVVYKASHSKYNSVAYKELLIMVTESDRMKVVNEFTIHSKAIHPNIAKVYGFVFEPRHYGIALEFADNGNMLQYSIRSRPEMKETIRMMQEVASGMNYLHNKNPPIIHGDLKIENVLIDSNLTAKICDFGHSNWNNYSGSVSKNKIVSGTITHIPPENWEDEYRRKKESFDLYGFGIFMFEAFTLKKPFDGASNAQIPFMVLNGKRPLVTEISPDVPEKCIALMEECWQHAANARPSFQEIKKKLKLAISKTDSDNLVEEESYQFKCEYPDISLKDRIQVEDGKELAGVTWLEDKLYVVLNRGQHIYVFSDEKPHGRLPEEESDIPEMRDPLDITASREGRAVFITDESDNGSVWKYQIPERKIERFQLDGTPRTLSVNSKGELLIVVDSDFRRYVDLYKSSDVTRLKRILFPLESTLAARHVVQAANGTNFIVLHFGEDKVWLVSEMNDRGQFIRTFHVSLVLNPVHVAVDEFGQIFVCDFAGHKVVLINSQLKKHRPILDFDHNQIFGPGRLLYDQKKRQLIVGQSRLMGNVKKLSSAISIFSL